MTGFQKTFDDAQRIMATASMSEAEAPFMEFVVEDRFDDIDQGRLHDSVSNCRYPQRTRFIATGFGNLDSPHRLRMISPHLQLLTQSFDFRVWPNRVHITVTDCSFVFGCSPPFLLKTQLPLTMGR